VYRDEEDGIDTLCDNEVLVQDQKEEKEPPVIKAGGGERSQQQCPAVINITTIQNLYV